ncbi:hypothetical protein MKJ04_15155 [Pontibacter sp. E15-1]|uniref:hypothetical protein n=1 Tax=Pontibacter sp. E15-1 TaxID=2919918 RepID=UPI001F4FFB76|nr:hypothetical protein [Pontibacter sp. E15-1]MCJ8166184.1 hypothetical protein [Pontibacter sp. E15-1]
MIGFLRSIFGMEETAGTRTVAGSPGNPDAKDTAYLRESKRRLNELHHLVDRYKGTQHSAQLQAVYEKTKRIHTYLADKQKWYELEVFHLQHTDHFLSTYTVIMDAHQQHRKAAHRSATARASAAVRRAASGLFRSDRKEVKAVQQTNRETSQRALRDLTEANAKVPQLTLPHISINTFAKVAYLQEGPSGTLTTHEIGFTSTTEEKTEFIAYISERLGLEHITYVGNAIAELPTQHTDQPIEMVPVIHWNGCPYAINLEDERLFPVRTYRNSR